jgi:E3 ubiquitin-protein ligase RNF14
MDASGDDERDEELSSIAAIFQELTVDSSNPYSVSLDIPVAPTEPISVRFPSAVDGAPPTTLPTATVVGGGANGNRPPTDQDTHVLSYLPPLRLQITLPVGYPSEKPPVVQLSTSPPWLPSDIIKRLQQQVFAIWEEYGHMQVVFSYIDFLEQAAEEGFDLASKGNGVVELDQDIKIALLDFDLKTGRQKFEQETFECGICLEPKKGSSCYRLQKCSHVFCIPCLQDFYNNAITEGDVASVKCLAPDCGVTRNTNTGRVKKSGKTLGPNELLQIPIERPMVQRYVDLKRKKKLESDKNTVYCPRQWCQGPARSKRYPKKDLSQISDEDSDSESEALTPVDGQTKKPLQLSEDRLKICEDCNYAFCRVCLAGWHGELLRCWPRSTAELTEEEQATYDYIRKNTSPCPECSVPCQKTHGCNHMNCYQCNAHFCYLCSAWLDPQNPYAHFNNKKIDCYQRLWELEEGDEGAGNVQFGGARQWEALAVAQEAEEREREQQRQHEEGNHGGQPEPQDAHAPGGPPLPPPQEPILVALAAVDLNADNANEDGDLEDVPPGPDAAANIGLNQFFARAPAGQPRRPRRPGLAGVPLRGRNEPWDLGAARAAHGGGGAAERREIQRLELQNFLRMAMEDREDEWDSDELDDEGNDAAWAFPDANEADAAGLEDRGLQADGGGDGDGDGDRREAAMGIREMEGAAGRGERRRGR